MKISTRGRYALRMMADLAIHEKDGYVPLKDISERQHVSKKYLEQIIPFLNRSNLLLTAKGAMGGYRLAKSPSEITVLEILESTEGALTPVSCLDSSPKLCDNFSSCVTYPVYEGLYRVVTEYLSGITLQNLLDDKTLAKEGTDSQE